MPTVVLHIGMPAAEATALRTSFRDHDDGCVRYARLGSDRNDSRLVNTLFGQLGRSAPVATRLSLFDEVERELGRGAERLVLSLNPTCLRDHDSIVQFLLFFVEREIDFRVLAYVAEPTTFATSVFRQEVSAQSINAFKIPQPRYGRLFGRWQRVFGDIDFIRYDSARSAPDTVVADFAERIGADPSPPPRRPARKRLSPAALSLLYFWNIEARLAYRSETAERDFRFAANLIDEHFDGTFRFDDAAVSAVTSEEDRRWLDENCRLTLPDSLAGTAREPGPTLIASEQDLHAIRTESLQPLKALLDRHEVAHQGCYNSSELITRLMTAASRKPRSFAAARVDGVV